MDVFIRCEQYNFIRQQVQNLINGYATVNDNDVLNALKSLIMGKVLNCFEDLSKEQEKLIEPILAIKDSSDAEVYFSRLKEYVIPFKEVSEQSIKRLFPKVKKLKVPKMENVDRRELIYLAWDDPGSNKRLIVTEYERRLIGLEGTFQRINQKGMCTICNSYAEIGLFTTKNKGQDRDSYTVKGNYICQDNEKCNANISSLDKLINFIDLLKRIKK